MEALKFRPSLRNRNSKSERVEVGKLVELASSALSRREGLAVDLDSEEELNEILRVGTSAGGARAKAVVALNPQTGEVRSGQAKAPAGFEHRLMKLDGATAAFDGVRDPRRMGGLNTPMISWPGGRASLYPNAGCLRKAGVRTSCPTALIVLLVAASCNSHRAVRPAVAFAEALLGRPICC